MHTLNLLTTLTLSITVLLALTWAVALPSAAASGTHYVAPGGECHGATPCYATLQAAIDAASPGDELRVAQGVYTDVTAREYNLTYPQTVTQALFIDKSLTVRGGYTVTDWTTAQPVAYPTVGLWDFAWRIHREVNFSPRITQIALIFLFFRVNSRYSRLILAQPCEILKSPHSH